MKEKLRGTLIYNPLAGMLDIRPTIASLIQIWEANGWSLDVFATTHQGHARELAESCAAAGSRLVLAVGGDGTIGEIVNGLVDTETVLAPFPGGTGNSFAKELNLPLRNLLGKRDLIRASRALMNGEIHYVDVGLTEFNQAWLQWAGVGIDSSLVKRIEPRSKFVRRMGSIGYYLLGLPTLIGYRGMKARVEVDGRLYQGEYLMVVVANCRNYAAGSVVLNPGSVLDDGFFEVCFFSGTNIFDLIRHYIRLHRKIHFDGGGISIVKGRQVRIDTEPILPVHFDGDLAGYSPVICHVKPKALRLLVPDTAPRDQFVLPGEPFP